MREDEGIDRSRYAVRAASRGGRDGNTGKCVSGGRLNAYKALSDDDIHSYAGNASGHSCSGTKCDYWESHTYSVSQYNASQHKLYCAQCSYVSYANHTVRVGSTICLDCGYNTSGPGIMEVEDVVCITA